MIVDKKTLNYFKRDMRKLSSRLFYSKFSRLSHCRVKAEDNRGKMMYHYICACCGNKYLPEDKLVQIDHIDAVGEFKYECINPSEPKKQQLFKIDVTWLNRLFCNFSNLQMLCLYCHQLKTKEDNAYTLYKGDLL